MSEQPYVQTYSIVAGSMACNARCGFCVSKMTPEQGVGTKLPEVNWRNFDIGVKYAEKYGASTAMITSKGEATLFPEQVTNFMLHLSDTDFPFKELQTNGINLVKPEYQQHLKDWYELGMTTIAVSVVHYDSVRNKEVYEPHKKEGMNLDELIDTLHEIGFSVRLSTVMQKGYIDNVEELDKMVSYAKEKGVEQLTFRPVAAPKESRDLQVLAYAHSHMLKSGTIDDMRDHLDDKGTRLQELVHGAIVYDYNGQNVCLANCLTRDSQDNAIRQVIFFPDGHVRYDWEHEGAILV